MCTQNWIRRRNRKRKAAEEQFESPLPKVKQKLTRWQCFAKKFSETEGKDQVLLNVILPYGYICAEGKVAKVINNAHFNKEVSKHYGALTEDERNELSEE